MATGSIKHSRKNLHTVHASRTSTTVKPPAAPPKTASEQKAHIATSLGLLAANLGPIAKDVQKAGDMLYRRAGTYPPDHLKGVAQAVSQLLEEFSEEIAGATKGIAEVAELAKALNAEAQS